MVVPELGEIKIGDGTDLSADLSSEVLGEGGSLGEGRGHPSHEKRNIGPVPDKRAA